MIALFSPKRRGWLVLAVLVVAALAGGAVWVLLDPPWGSSENRGAPRDDLTGAALTVNGEAISHDALAVAARRAEASYLQAGRVSASYLEGANGAFVRLVLVREATVSLVRQVLVVQEARARKIAIADKKLGEETQKTLTQLVEQSQSSGSDLSSILLDVGQSLDEFTADLREETRIRLLSDEVTLAVVGQIKPTDEVLRAFYESKKSTYGDDYNVAKDRVRSDYNRVEVSRRRDEWLTAQLAKADVKIVDPILAAFDLMKRGSDAGLKELERLAREKKSYDPYLPYYIARIYNDQAIAAFAERQDLEKSLGQAPTGEQTAKLETVRNRQKDATAKAIAGYAATLTSAPADSDLLRRIVQLNPPVAVTALTMGLTSLSNGDFAGAESKLQEALGLDASLAVARIALGDVAARRGDITKAVSLYREAASSSPKDVDILLTVGDAYLSIGQLAEAEKQLRAARAVAPEYVRLWVAEGDLALHRLNSAADERDGLQVKETRTASEEARLAAVKKEITDLHAAAHRAYERALAKGDSEALRVRSGNADVLVGQYEAASASFHTVLRRSTHYPEAHVGLGDVLAALGDPNTALAHYEAALGRTLTTSQQIGVFTRVLSIDPTNGPARLAYGIALTRASRWGEAIAELSRILEAQPDHIQAALWIAESYSALGDYASAITHLKKGFAGTATPAAKDSARAQILATLKEQVDAGGRPSSDALDLLIDVARSFLGSGYPADAVEALALLAAIDPTYRQAEVLRLIEAAKTTPAKSQGTMD